MLLENACKLSQMPMIPEESWRRTNPEIFFLPDNEVTNAAGKSLSSTNSFVWGRNEIALTADAFENALAEVPRVGPALKQWAANLEILSRIYLLKLSSGKAELLSLIGNKKTPLKLTSRPVAPSSVIPGSLISLSVNQRLGASVGEEVCLEIAANGDADPIVIVQQGGDSTSQQYSMLNITVKQNARASVAVIDGAGSFAMRRHTIILEPEAKVNELWFHAGNTELGASRTLLERVVHLAASSEFRDAQVFAPAGTLRVVSNILMDGKGAQAYSGAAVVARGNSRFDYEPRQHHVVPASRSNLRAKFLVSDTARAVFQGLIRVEQAAVQTFALQENKNLLLGSVARIAAMPRLEILPDDVVCKHGSATGELDTKRLFYLTTRGFSLSAAKTMIVQGFVRDGLGWLESDDNLQPLSDSLLSMLLETVSVE